MLHPTNIYSVIERLRNLGMGECRAITLNNFQNSLELLMFPAWTNCRQSKSSLQATRVVWSDNETSWTIYSMFCATPVTWKTEENLKRLQNFCLISHSGNFTLVCRCSSTVVVLTKLAEAGMATEHGSVNIKLQSSSVLQNTLIPTQSMEDSGDNPWPSVFVISRLFESGYVMG